MIHILFPAGAFGSSIEYCLRQFSEEFYDKTLDDVDIKADGSMHTFHKFFHPTYKSELLSLPIQTVPITTPTYANNDQDSQEVIDTLAQVKNRVDKVVIITIENLEEHLQKELLAIHKQDFKYWALHYNFLKNPDLEHWEKIERFSLSLHNVSNLKIPADWIQVSFSNLLTNYQKTIQNIINKLGLTLINKDKFDRFSKKFETFQIKILDENYYPIRDYVDNAILGNNFVRNDFTFLQEVIAVRLLLYHGYEIQYPDTDAYRRLPRVARELNKLLIKL
jgi:hypothetical protein